MHVISSIGNALNVTDLADAIVPLNLEKVPKGYFAVFSYLPVELCSQVLQQSCTAVQQVVLSTFAFKYGPAFLSNFVADVIGFRAKISGISDFLEKTIAEATLPHIFKHKINIAELSEVHKLTKILAETISEEELKPDASKSRIFLKVLSVGKKTFEDICKSSEDLQFLEDLSGFYKKYMKLGSVSLVSNACSIFAEYLQQQVASFASEASYGVSRNFTECVFILSGMPRSEMDYVL